MPNRRKIPRDDLRFPDGGPALNRMPVRGNTGPKPGQRTALDDLIKATGRGERTIPSAGGAVPEGMIPRSFQPVAPRATGPANQQREQQLAARARQVGRDVGRVQRGAIDEALTRKRRRRV